VKGGLFLDVVVRKRTSVFQLLSSEDQSLLLRRNSFFVLDLGLDVGNGVIGFNVQRNRLAGKGLDEDLHGTTSKTKDQVEGGLLLDVVVRKSTSIFQLFSSEDQSLLLRRNSLFILNLGLDVGDGVVGFNVESNRLAGKGLDEDLHGTTSKTKDQVKGGLFLDVVVRKRTSVFQLLSSEDQSLLLRRNSFFVLDLGLDVGNGVIGFNVQRNRLAGKGLDEDLHGTTSKTKDQVEGGLFLDVVVRKGSSVFQLLSSEDQSLLFRRNALFVLDLGLDIGDGVVGFNVQRNRLAGEGLDENLHGTTTKTKDQVKSGLFLDVVVAESPSVLELFTSEDQSLLLWGDAFLVLDLGFDVGDGVVGLYVQGNRLAGEGLDEDLHSTTAKSKHQVECGFFLNVVIGKSSSVFKLFSSENQTLLLRRNPLFILNLGLDVGNRVVGLDIKRNRFPCEGFDENLHCHLGF